MAVKDAVGRYGERLAARHLQAAGWTVIARNWRSPEREAPGELDIVALDGDTLVFVEVKTRRHGGRGTAVEAVTPHKLRQVRRLSGVWLAQMRGQGFPVASGLRIDVLAVHLPRAGAATILHVQGVD